MKRIYKVFIILAFCFGTSCFLSAAFTNKVSAVNRIKNSDCSVTGLKASSVQETKATLSYQFKGLKVVEFGICYNTEGNPTVTSLKVVEYNDEPKDVPEYISSKSNLRGLSEGTKYFVKAYVVAQGGEVCYSNEVEFSTPKEFDFSAMLNGPKTEYYANGKVMKKYQMKDGKVDGLYEFYNESGNLVSSQMIKDGVPNGPMTTFYGNGNRESVTNFRDGLPEGERISYYPDGTTKMKSNCTGELSKLSCEIKNYYPDGSLQSESSTSNGEFVYAIKYDQHGRVVSEEKPGSNISYRYDNDGWKHTSINGAKCQCSKCVN